MPSAVLKPKNVVAVCVALGLSFLVPSGSARAFAHLNFLQAGIGGGSDEDAPASPVGDVQARYNTLELDVLDDKLVGDQIDLDTGSLSLQQMDVSILGNSDLPVEFGRKLSRNSLRSNMIGNWEAAIPYITRNYALRGTFPWNSGEFTAGRNSDRCSGQLYPANVEVPLSDPVVVLRAESYFNGIQLNVPGRNPGTLAQARSTSGAIISPEFATTPARLVSTQNWYVGCIPSIPAGGEGYEAIAPNGDRYKFTHLHESPLRSFDYGNSSFDVVAQTLYASEVTDVHGNWVRYEYSGANLTRIHANDGREITFTYTSGRLSSVNANGRTWQYLYAANGNLERVNEPDGRYWTFTTNPLHLLAVDPVISEDICFKIAVPDIDIRHPSGTQVKFKFEPILNGRKNVVFSQEVFPWINTSLHSGPEAAPPESFTECFEGDRRSRIPSAFWSFAVIEKQVTLPGGPVYT